MGITFSPPAVIFINTDLTAQVLSVFVSQLYITQVMDAATFDATVASDPYFLKRTYRCHDDGDPCHRHHCHDGYVPQDGYRILVLRDLHDLTNRNLANIVLFAKAGLVSVLHNNFGPPGATLPIARVYLTALINLQKYQHWWFEWHRAAHGYEQSWKGEPTNNDDFNPWHLDPHHNVEPRDE